jgi:hypothetical protein
MRLAIACAMAIGCTGSALRVEPEVIDVDVDLAQPAPQVELRVFLDDKDVTEEASFAVAGKPLGTMAGAQWISDGHTGGTGSITVSAAGATAMVPVTATVHETRFCGVPAEAANWFTSQDVAVVQPLDPEDGAVLPPTLGKLEVDFGADDADDIHEVAVTAPYLDIRVYAPGAPGPRHLELDADEWQAIGSTTRGDGFALDVRSTKTGGGAAVHTVSSHLEVADLDASTLVFGGADTDANGGLTGRPELYRYDMPHAAITPFASADCIGCHIAVSPDGKRIAAAGMATPGSGVIVGMTIDVASGAVTISNDAWNTGVYDPGGRLLTSLTATGELTLRDGTTAAPIMTVPLGEPAAGPAISSDGRSLAYAVMAAPEANNPAGTALRVRPWDAATGNVGTPITVATDAGILAPQFSSDGAWIVYTRSTEPTERGIVGGAVVRADGSAPPVVLTTGLGDQIPRWASPVASVRSGGRDAEPIVWIAFSSSRAVGPVPMLVKSLWVAAFYPARGVLARPFHLPGQSRMFSALHSPYALTPGAQ